MEIDVMRVASAMTDALGSEVKEAQIIKLPDDGTTGHLSTGHWDVYAARSGEFVLVAYVYPGEEEIDVEVI